MRSCNSLQIAHTTAAARLVGGLLFLLLGTLPTLRAQQDAMAANPESGAALGPANPLRYRVADIYIIGLDVLGEEYILRYLRENGLRAEALRTKQQLEKAALHMARIADGDTSLLAMELSYDYDESQEVPEVYVEVLVSEMSISFIPGGGNAFARLGWANRIQRNGRASRIWLALGYNRQDLSLELPYLWGTPLGFKLDFGHNILDQWDFSDSSRIRSNAFVRPELYLLVLSWLKLGIGLDTGLLYFYKGRSPSSLRVGQTLGLGPQLNGKDVPGKLHGRLALLGRLELDRNYLARRGLGYHLLLSSRHEVAGVFAGNHALGAKLGLVTEPVPWFRPSFELRGNWQSEGLLPLDSEVFSSKYEGYIRAAAELRLLFTPLHIRDPLAIDIGLNLGAIVGFANASQDFGQINLERDLELSLFIGPEIYWGMPINVRTRFDFGIIFREQLQKVAFAFHIQVF